MTELLRFKKALDEDTGLRLRYLNLLDKLMTDGEITPEMTSVAARKLGFEISAEEFRNDRGESELDTDEPDCISGGLFTIDDLAPDGRRVGCPYNFYLTWTDYWIKNPDQRCPGGGVHEPCENSAGRVCRKCRLELDERGVIDLIDRDGNEIK